MDGYWGIFLSAVFTAKGCCDITERRVGSGVKAIAMTLDYPVTKGIPIKQIDTHSLHLRYECLIFCGIFRYSNQKDGLLTQQDIQGEHVRTVLNLLEGMS